jgi:predicted ATPase
MITRIKINGFKSLLDTELYLGPFTCIAGANATGKSNFFDALNFLSKLSDNTILQAIKSIRSENQKHSEIKDIFFKSGSLYFETMNFEIDMIVPKEAEDDLGQNATASITSLRYTLELKLNDAVFDKEPIQIIKEELKPIPLTEIRKSLHFGAKKAWVDSVVFGKKTTAFISTVNGQIKLHQDGKKGRTTSFISDKMPRTLLSTVTSESPTAFLVRQEMRNWMMLQFEPSALRQPNSISDVKNSEISANGSNLPATLFRLYKEGKNNDIYQRLTNNLKGLVNDVQEITVEENERLNLLTLKVEFKDGLCLPAQSLSDGTLRFLGLAITAEDNSSGLICLEEPENGINPRKIGEMVRLLEDMATDTDAAMDKDNPLRQVIINSHSPLVVSAVADDSLYLAAEKETFNELLNKKLTHTSFTALNGTWKTNNLLAPHTSLGQILDYLEGGNGQKNLALETTFNAINAPKKKTTVAQNINKQLEIFS